MDRAIDRAALVVNRVNALDGLAVRTGSGQVVDDVDALDDQDFLFELDFARDVGGQLVDSDLARCQRASEGSRQSTGGRCDNIVPSCGMGLQHVRWNSVMFRHRAVDTKDYGF